MSERPTHLQADDLIEHIQGVTAEHDQERRLTDAERIAHGLARAERKNGVINHLTARIIASQLHDGQDSGLYSFASCGAIDKERLGPELTGTYIQEDASDEVKTWIEQLGRYLDRYDDRGPVHDWNAHFNYSGLDADDCCTGCGAHFSEPHAPDCEQSREGENNQPIEIYVASLTDYNNGHLHGVWLDATLDPDDLQRGVEFMLRNSYYPDAEEWAIHDTSGFEGLNVGEWTSFETVYILANGIEEHGEAFVHWIEYMDLGLTNVQEVADKFEDNYQGHFDSPRAYAEHILDAGEYSRLIDEFKDQLPDHLRDHMTFDIDGYTDALGSEVHMANASDGCVYVFNL